MPEKHWFTVEVDEKSGNDIANPGVEWFPRTYVHFFGGPRMSSVSSHEVQIHRRVCGSLSGVSPEKNCE